MNLFLTCPGSFPHGGIRVILEWATRLAARGHTVTLRVPRPSDVAGFGWFGPLPGVRLATDDASLRGADTLIVCSPHGIDYLTHRHAPERRFTFMQMLEGLFRPDDVAWREECRKFEQADVPMFLISRWNEKALRSAGRTAPTHYIGNGVNLDHFPLETAAKKDGCTVLVEGWNALNPSKDVDRVAPRVAKRLREQGCRILAYSQIPATDYQDVPHEFYAKPSTARLNDLYRRATILLKASRYDARACAPVEAMTKGTPTVRAIELGDDDLTHGENAVRCAYEEGATFRAVKDLLGNPAQLQRLSEACLRYVGTYTWDHWMDRVEGVLTT